MKEKHPDDPDVEYVPHGFDPDEFLNHYSLEPYREDAENGDPTAIIDAFLRAHADFCYPRWLLSKIHQAFRMYYTGKKISLDDAFGLSPAKWTKRSLESHHWLMAMDLYLLTSGLKVSLNKAAEIVAWKMADAENNSKTERKRSLYLNAETLKRRYCREWKTRFNLEAEPPMPPCYQGWPDRSPQDIVADWRTFLSTFPPSALDKHLPKKIRTSFL